MKEFRRGRIEQFARHIRGGKLPAARFFAPRAMNLYVGVRRRDWNRSNVVGANAKEHGHDLFHKLGLGNVVSGQGIQSIA